MTLNDWLQTWRAKWRKGVTPEQLRQVMLEADKKADDDRLRRQQRLAAQSVKRNARPGAHDERPPRVRAQTRLPRGPGAPHSLSPSESARDIMAGGHGLNVLNFVFAFTEVLGRASAAFGRAITYQATHPAPAEAPARGRTGDRHNGGPARVARATSNVRQGSEAGAPAGARRAAPPRERPVELAQMDWQERWERMTPAERRREQMELDSERRTGGLANDLYDQIAGQLLDYTDLQGNKPPLNDAALREFDPDLRTWLREAQNHSTYLAMRELLQREITEAHADAKARAKAEHRRPDVFDRSRLPYIVYEHAEDLRTQVGTWLNWRREQEALRLRAANNGVDPEAGGDGDAGGADHVPPTPRF